MHFNAIGKSFLPVTIRRPQRAALGRHIHALPSTVATCGNRGTVQSEFVCKVFVVVVVAQNGGRIIYLEICLVADRILPLAVGVTRKKLAGSWVRYR